MSNNLLKQAAYTLSGSFVLLASLACVSSIPPPVVPQPQPAPQSRVQGVAPELVQRPNAQGLYQARSNRDGSPLSFVQVLSNEWEAFPYRSELSARDVHERVVSLILNKGLSTDELSPRDYTGRTHWNHTFATNGVHNSEYRTRVQWKVLQEEGILRFKVEAQFGRGGNWINGFDTDAMKNLRDDLINRVR
jgi:hypothetical protein